MGMMLRRNNRRGDYNPKVNGQPVKQEPKTKVLNSEPNYNGSTSSTTKYSNIRI